MKKIVLLPVLLFLITACSTQKKMINQAFYYGVMGQKENEVYARVGLPSKSYHTEDGGKVLVYEVPEIRMDGYSKNTEQGVTPRYNEKGKRVYDADMTKVVSAQSNAKLFSKYGTHMSNLCIYLDDEGICNRIDQNLPKVQLEYYYDRLKKYIPEK